VRSKWILEIHDETAAAASLISSHEFENLPSLRTKMVENRGRAFLVRVPSHATQGDFVGLLDLRDQGFRIERL
jgi:hypothetical protein